MTKQITRRAFRDRLDSGKHIIFASLSEADRTVFLKQQRELDRIGSTLFGDMHWNRMVDPINGQFASEIQRAS
jgi:hypothetical protein